jgi:hypothetical protein
MMWNQSMVVSPMDKEDLIKEFIQIKRNGLHSEIHVCTISWDGPHTPISGWKLYVTLDSEKSESDIKPAIQALLNDKKYFCTCKECGERNPKGWMSSKDICQSCAEKNHGIVH